MQGLDTNLLVRLAAQDDTDQTAAVNALLSSGAAADEGFFVCLIVLCEVLWVLGTKYQFDRAGVSRFVGRLLAFPAIEFERRDIVDEALAKFVGSNADFPDILIGLINREYGCTTTLTFDRKAARLPDFELVT